MQLSVRQVEEFMRNPVWEEIAAALYNKINDCRDMLEEATDLDVVKRVQGELFSLRWVHSIPEILLEDLKKVTGQEPTTEIDEEETRDE